MRLLTRLGTCKNMYPNNCLINSEINKIIVFEKDINNPNNEGFIEFWEIVDLNKKQLKFKKRTTKDKALSLWNSLIKEGWEIVEKQNAA